MRVGIITQRKWRAGCFDKKRASDQKVTGSSPAGRAIHQRLTQLSKICFLNCSGCWARFRFEGSSEEPRAVETKIAEAGNPFGEPVAKVDAMPYDKANRFLRAFNNGRTIFVGRVWYNYASRPEFK